MNNVVSIIETKRSKRYSKPTGQVVHIELFEDLETPAMNALRVQFQLKQWRENMRQAKPDPNDPDTWDWYALDNLDRDYERAFLP